MTSMEQRERGVERKYVHDEEIKFKVHACTMRLLGQWAAERLGLLGEAAEDYAHALVMADFEADDDAYFVRHLQVDFAKAGLAIGEDAIVQKQAQLYPHAFSKVTGHA